MSIFSLKDQAKLLKGIMYAAISAPLVVDILDAVGVEIDPTTKAVIRWSSPVVAGASGLALRRKVDLLNELAVCSEGGNITDTFTKGHGKQQKVFEVVTHAAGQSWIPEHDYKVLVEDPQKFLDMLEPAPGDHVN